MKQMRHHLQSIIKEKNEYFYLLTVIERFLLRIKKEHDIHNIKELENHLIEEVKEESSEVHIKHQLEFIKIVKEFVEAFDLARIAHKDQKRKGGEDYIVHPISACLNEIYHQEEETHFFNENTIISALLHDTLEDTSTSHKEIYDKFGLKVAQIVENLTDHPQWERWHKEGHLTKLEESALQFVNASKLDESLDVKFDDRLDNLETIDAMPEQKIVEKIIDTLCVGYIERALELKEYKFLKVLKKCTDQYLTQEMVKKYYGNDLAITSLVEKGRVKIKNILKSL